MAIGPAVSDCIELWNKALDSETGILVTFKSRDARTRMLQRMYSARARVRKENKRELPPEDPMHDRSVWDQLVMIPKGDTQVRIGMPKLDEETSGILNIMEWEE